MNTTTPSLRATPSEEGERIPKATLAAVKGSRATPLEEGERIPKATLAAVKGSRATPLEEGERIPKATLAAVKGSRATPLEDGERIPNAENSPSSEGVARSDGVADFSGSNEVAVSKTTPKLNHLPYNPALKQRAKELRKAGNLSEALFWNEVKNGQLNGLDFDRQRIIGNYIVDFYCYELALVVEIDGSSHDDKQEYDLARDQYLEALGLKVCHVTDTDVKTNLEGVLMLISLSIK